MKNIVVFDLETTGLSKSKDYIIQFAGIKVDNESGNIIDELNLYIQPEGNYTIGFGAYFKHGITPKFLMDKPHLKDVAKQIIDFIGDNDLLTYNGNSFDIPFLISRLHAVGYDISFKLNNCYDAFLEEKRRNGNKLGETYKRYVGQTMEESGLAAHDALSDVKATYRVFQEQQKQKEYSPEKIICEDNVITDMEFNKTIVPCFSIGKYKGLSVKFVTTVDMGYINWCINDSDFFESTKEYIKNIVKEQNAKNS